MSEGHGNFFFPEKATFLLLLKAEEGKGCFGEKKLCSNTGGTPSAYANLRFACLNFLFLVHPPSADELKFYFLKKIKRN